MTEEQKYQQEYQTKTFLCNAWAAVQISTIKPSVAAVLADEALKEFDYSPVPLVIPDHEKLSCKPGQEHGKKI